MCSSSLSAVTDRVNVCSPWKQCTTYSVWTTSFSSPADSVMTHNRSVEGSNPSGPTFFSIRFTHKMPGHAWHFVFNSAPFTSQFRVDDQVATTGLIHLRLH